MSIKIIVFFSIFALVAVERCVAQTISIYHQPWYEKSLGSDEITFIWQTSDPTWGEVYIVPFNGMDSLHPGFDFTDQALIMSHYITIIGLSHSTLYRVKLISRNKDGSSADTVSFFTCTSSWDVSTGAVQVYFNRSVDSTTFPQLPRAHGNADFLSLLLDRINSAKHSIDLALYSFSGTIGSTVAHALLDAQSRGVKIRLIMDSASSRSSSAYATLSDAGIPVITNGFGASEKKWSNIHHNKFIIFDGRGYYPTDAWVHTGSWNLTNQQTTTDYQNLIYIQDESLAIAYEREFEQEWGSSADLPDSANSRFSTSKLDVAPHTFNIHGTEMHLLFSPQDQVANAIDSELTTAYSQILFSMYSFTLPSLAQELVTANQNQIDVHGIIGSGGSSDQIPFLQSSGLDVVHFSDYLGLDTLFHHKYCLLDPDKPDPTVLTGSYNWTRSADSLNNENILFIRDKAVSDAYLQEWIQRYHENGGTRIYLAGVQQMQNVQSSAVIVYPNPSSDKFEITWSQKGSGLARIYVSDPLGRVLLDKTEFLQEGENREIINNSWGNGSYYVRVDRPALSSGVCIVVQK